MSNRDVFVRWFQRATGNEPYPFQIRFADGDWLRNAVPVPGYQGGVEGGRGQGGGLLVDVPTGMGKTAMVLLGWLRWC